MTVITGRGGTRSAHSSPPLALVQTSDTRAAKPGVPYRPTTNSFSGYEVWRWADTLQASLAIYMRIRPGVGAAQRPARYRDYGWYEH